MALLEPPADGVNPPGFSAAEALERWDAADDATRARLFEVFHPQLRQIAARHMLRERPDHTLQASAIVNELFLNLARQKQMTFKGQAHFLAFASRFMHRFLIDYARSHGATRHGGYAIKVQLDATHELSAGPLGLDERLDLDELLKRFSAEDPRAAEVVELRYFGGMTFKEIAAVFSIDERTAKRDWEYAKGWLFGEMEKNRDGSGNDRGQSNAG